MRTLSTWAAVWPYPWSQSSSGSPNRLRQVAHLDPGGVPEKPDDGVAGLVTRAGARVRLVDGEAVDDVGVQLVDAVELVGEELRWSHGPQGRTVA